MTLPSKLNKTLEALNSRINNAAIKIIMTLEKYKPVLLNAMKNTHIIKAFNI